MTVKGLLRFADVEPGGHNYAGAAKLSKPGLLNRSVRPGLQWVLFGLEGCWLAGRSSGYGWLDPTKRKVADGLGTAARADGAPPGRETGVRPAGSDRDANGSHTSPAPCGDWQ